MIRKQHGNTLWYEFELLQPFPALRHACFVHPHLPSALPIDNREPPFVGSIIAPLQHHSSEVIVLNSPLPAVVHADAVATTLPNLTLLIRHADCQACLLFDPEHLAIANVHAGWRGNVLNIYQATIERMKQEWGTRPETVLACIGPSLGPCHAEFQGWRDLFPPSFEPFQTSANYFDLWAIGRHQLLSCGLVPEHIEMANMCTYCHPEGFLSYRRDKTTQRHATCITLCP